VGFTTVINLVIYVLPLLVAVAVGYAKKAGAPTSSAPFLTVVFSVFAGVLVWAIFPDRDVGEIINTITLGLGAGTIYSLKKRYGPGST